MKMMSEQEQDVIAEAYKSRIRPGYYHAVCTSVTSGVSFGGRRDIYIRFKIHGGEYHGTQLYMACTYPKGKMSPRHKYYQQWMLANGGPPEKGQRLGRKIFPHRLYLIVVRDTQKKFPNGKPMPDYMQYSVVDTIIKPLTGKGNKG